MDSVLGESGVYGRDFIMFNGVYTFLIAIEDGRLEILRLALYVRD